MPYVLRTQEHVHKTHTHTDQLHAVYQEALSHIHDEHGKPIPLTQIPWLTSQPEAAHAPRDLWAFFRRFWENQTRVGFRPMNRICIHC